MMQSNSQTLIVSMNACVRELMCMIHESYETGCVGYCVVTMILGKPQAHVFFLIVAHHFGHDM